MSGTNDQNNSTSFRDAYKKAVEGGIITPQGAIKSEGWAPLPGPSNNLTSQDSKSDQNKSSGK